MLQQHSEDRLKVPVFTRVTDALSGKVKPLGYLPAAEHIQKLPGVLLGYKYTAPDKVYLDPHVGISGYVICWYGNSGFDGFSKGGLALLTDQESRDWLRYCWFSRERILARSIEREGGREHYQDKEFRYEDLLFWPAGAVVQTFAPEWQVTQLAGVNR